MIRLAISILSACVVIGCSPRPKAADTSQKINAGVNIVPEAMLASAKLPPSTHPTVMDQPDLIDVISNSDQKHYVLVELLRGSGLVPTLQQAGPYTILAPTDEAFGKLPPGVIDRLLLPSHRAELVAFVRYHLVNGRISFADMLQTNGQIPTLAGDNVVIRGINDKTMINDANVIRSETSASNGVVHWIDSVLLPPA